jgi:SAM-dependent methyltransferase
LSTTAANPYWLTKEAQAYHVRQFETPYRSTIALGEFARRYVRQDARLGLDVACGAGANLFHFSKLFPEISWTGVDMAAEVLEIGRSVWADRSHGLREPRLIEGDLFRLAEDLGPESFDIVFLLQTLSWLPSYEDAMMQLLAVTKPGGTVIVSSLFTDELIDATTVVQQFTDDGSFTPLLGDGLNYNVYCYDRFISVCRELGASKVEAQDFIIDADLPKPPTRQLGTFTRKLDDGTRLQQTGPLFLPWKFIAITK